MPTPTPASDSSSHDLFSQSVHTDDIDVDSLMNPDCGISDIEVMDRHLNVSSNNIIKQKIWIITVISYISAAIFLREQLIYFVFIYLFIFLKS